jgi:hypothetical protein
MKNTIHSLAAERLRDSILHPNHRGPAVYLPVAIAGLPHGCCGWGKTLEKVSRHGNLFRQMAGRVLSIMTPPGAPPYFT